jgi:hypothetical protein
MDILVAGLCFWFCATIIVSRLQNRKQIANFAVSLATLGLTVFSREAWSRCFSRGLVSPLFLFVFLLYCCLTIAGRLFIFLVSYLSLDLTGFSTAILDFDWMLTFRLLFVDLGKDCLPRFLVVLMAEGWDPRLFLFLYLSDFAFL